MKKQNVLFTLMGLFFLLTSCSSNGHINNKMVLIRDVNKKIDLKKILPFNPFDFMYFYNLEHNIIWLDEHEKYDAVEIHRTGFGTLQFTVTLQSMEQIDYINNKIVVEERKKYSTENRKVAYANISMETKYTGNTSVLSTVKAQLPDGEAIEMVFEGQIEQNDKKHPKSIYCAIDPTGHSTDRLIPVMQSGRENFFSTEKTFVKIDGKEVAIKKNYDPTFGDSKLKAVFVKGFHLGLIIPDTRQEKIIDIREKAENLQFITLVDNNKKKEYTVIKNTIENDERIITLEEKTGTVFKNRIIYKPLYHGYEIRKIEVLEISGKVMTVSFLGGLVIPVSLPEESKHYQSKSVFFVSLEKGKNLLGGEINILSRKTDKGILTTLTLKGTTPSWARKSVFTMSINIDGENYSVDSRFEIKKTKASVRKPITMTDVTWEDIALLPRDKTVFFVPSGPIEQFGPHLPLATDPFAAIQISKKAAEYFLEKNHDWYAVIMAPIYYGHAKYGMKFPGNISIKPETIKSLIYDIGESLIQHGFYNMVVINHHMEPRHVVAIEEGIRELRNTYNMHAINPLGALILKEIVPQERKNFDKALFGHGGEANSIFIMEYYPHLLNKERMRTLPNNNLNFEKNIMAASDFYNAGMIMGYSGNPKEILNPKSEFHIKFNGKKYVEHNAKPVADITDQMVHGIDVFERATNIFFGMGIFHTKNYKGKTESISYPQVEDQRMITKANAEIDLDITKVIEELVQYIKNKVYKKGLDTINKYLETYNNSSDLWAWKAVFMGILAGESVSVGESARYGMGASMAAQKALQIDPNNPMSHLSMGQIKMNTPEQYGGDIKVAIQEFETAMKLTNDKKMKEAIIKAMIEAYTKTGDKEKLSEYRNKLRKYEQN